MLQDLLQVAPGLLGDQAELIVIAEQERGAFHVARQLGALQPQNLLARIVQIGDAQLATFAGNFIMASGALGETTTRSGFLRRSFRDCEAE